MRFVAAVAIAAAVLAAGAPGALTASAAPDGPGSLSHFDLARKDCLGTARNTTSKVWYTVADGVLSDVYYPTADTTNVETLQYVVTDGSTFTDLQTRDTTYDGPGARPRRDGVPCDEHGEERPLPHRHRLPHRPGPRHGADARALRAADRRGDDYRLYVRLDPTVNGNGGGGAGNGGADTGTRRHLDRPPGRSSPPTPSRTTNAVNRDYAQPVFAALDSHRLSQATNGFAGAASDPLTQLDARARADDDVHRRAHGNLVQAARLGSAATRRSRCARVRRRRRLARSTPRKARSARPRHARQRATRRAGPPTTRASRAADNLPGIAPPRAEDLVRRLLPERQRREGLRGQDVPRRDRRQPRLPWGQAVSAGDPRTPTSARTASLRPRPLRGVDGALRRRRPADGA